jgi:hypothetical protein
VFAAQIGGMKNITSGSWASELMVKGNSRP